MARNICMIPIRFISAFFIYLPHLDTNIYPSNAMVHPVQSQCEIRCLGLVRESLTPIIKDHDSWSINNRPLVMAIANEIF